MALMAAAWGVLGSVASLLLFGLLTLAFTASGWPFARWFAGDASDRVTRTILAALFGYLAGATVCSLLRLIGAGAPATVLVATGLVAFGAAWALRGRQEEVVSLVRLDRHDRVALTTLAVLTLIIIGPVFAHVGQPVPGGLAYRAYFNADLFAHMSVVAELVKGTAPPLNPFFPSEPLPYYWMYFTLPMLFAQLNPGLLVDRGILLTDTGAGVVFVAVGYVVIRNLAVSARATALAWITILLASSFEGAYFIWHQLSRGRSIDAFRVTNMDALTRWYWQLPGVDGLHRAMWWTPQHETALALGLIVLIVHVRARDPDSMNAGLVEGVMLGGALAISSFNGVLLVAWYALMQLLALARARGRTLGPWLRARFIAAVVVLAFAGLLIGLGIVQRTPGSFIWGWNRHFLRNPWWFLGLSFGPALFLAPLGLLAARRASRSLLHALGAMVVVAAAVFLLVDLRGHENTYVTFRTGHMIYLVLVVLLACAMDASRRWPLPGRVVFVIVWIVAFAAALPTVAFDWYNARDTSNLAISPGGFPWTMRISPDDQAAIAWVRQSVPSDRTIQTDGSQAGRARTEWAFVTAFLGHRMGVGSGIFELNPYRFDPMLNEIHDAFSAPDPDAAYEVFRRYGADFVYVGDVERAKNPGGIAKFNARADRFRSVFHRGTVDIYEIVR